MHTSVFTGGCQGGDRIIVGFTATCAISEYHYGSCELEYLSGEVCSVKYVSDLRHVGGFLRELRIPPNKKLTATI